MSKINLTFKNKKYSIDKSLLSGAISSLETTLSGLSGESDSVVGTWVFNDVIKCPPLEVDQSKGYPIKFTAFDQGDLYEFDEINFFRYEEDGFALGYYGYNPEVYLEDVYCLDDGGWKRQFNMIAIIEQPTDPEVIAWLKSNATRVEMDDTVIGYWKFNEQITSPSSYYAMDDNGIATMGYPVAFMAAGTAEGWTQFDKLSITWYYGLSDVADITYCNDAIGDEWAYLYDNNHWAQECFRTIVITEQPDDSEFIAWLKNNATRVEQDYTVIGRWVFNDVPNFEGIDFYFDFIAYSPTKESWITYNNLYDDSGPMVYDGDIILEPAFCNGAWIDDALKTIFIPIIPSDAEIITWLKANATKVI